MKPYLTARVRFITRVSLRERQVINLMIVLTMKLQLINTTIKIHKELHMD